MACVMCADRRFAGRPSAETAFRSRGSSGSVNPSSLRISATRSGEPALRRRAAARSRLCIRRAYPLDALRSASFVGYLARNAATSRVFFFRRSVPESGVEAISQPTRTDVGGVELGSAAIRIAGSSGMTVGEVRIAHAVVDVCGCWVGGGVLAESSDGVLEACLVQQ